MPKETITFALEGDVSLDNFAKMLSEFNLLINNLTREVGNNAAIDWIVEELYTGSAIASFHGVFEDVNIVERVVNAYEIVGETLAYGTEMP